jgi:hypothetical protein
MAYVHVLGVGVWPKWASEEVAAATGWKVWSLLSIFASCLGDHLSIADAVRVWIGVDSFVSC